MKKYLKHQCHSANVYYNKEHYCCYYTTTSTTSFNPKHDRQILELQKPNTQTDKQPQTLMGVVAQISKEQHTKIYLFLQY